METAGRAARAGAGHPASAQSASRGETENPDWSGGGNDMIWLTKEDLALTVPAERAAFRSPIPTQMVSNGEFMPARQTMQQRQVEERIKELADGLGGKLGLNRRKFLQTSCGMAAAFLAMNAVYGSVFTVDPAEAADPAAAAARLKALGHQFIFDDQVHFVRDDYTRERVLRLAEFAKNWNPVLKNQKITLQRYKFENFVKEIFMDSETKVALLSGAPFDDVEAWFLSNDQMVRARALINDLAGSRRLLCHALVVPGQPRWVEDTERTFEGLAGISRIEWVNKPNEDSRKCGGKSADGDRSKVIAEAAVRSRTQCAALEGTLSKGVRAGHVVWGTDSVWHGSPRW